MIYVKCDLTKNAPVICCVIYLLYSKTFNDEINISRLSIIKFAINFVPADNRDFALHAKEFHVKLYIVPILNGKAETSKQFYLFYVFGITYHYVR